MTEKDNRKLIVYQRMRPVHRAGDPQEADYVVEKIHNIVTFGGQQIYLGMLLPPETIQDMIGMGVDVIVQPAK